MLQVHAIAIRDFFEPAQTFDSFGSLVSVFLANAYVLAGLIGFVFLVFGGISFILGAGGGDSKRLESGKRTVTMAIIGLMVIVFSYWIVQILEFLTGVKILNPGI